MTDKRARLERLKSLGGRVPPTYWSLSDFLNAESDPVLRWWVRSTATDPDERYRHPQIVRNVKEIAAFAAGLEEQERKSDHFVVQRYLEPVISGITYASRGWTMSECVIGPSEPLLRGGTLGARFGKRGTDRWQMGTRGFPPGCTETVATAEREIVAFGEGILVEWISVADGEINHVDLKEIGLELIAEAPFPKPDRFVVGADTLLPKRHVADTSIANLSKDGQLLELTCASGSPLSHLCVEMATRGERVIVLNNRVERP